MGGLYHYKIYKNISRCGVLGIGKNEEKKPFLRGKKLIFIQIKNSTHFSTQFSDLANVAILNGIKMKKM